MGSTPTTLALRHSRQISVARPGVFLATDRLDVHRLFRVLHELHQASRHVVRPRNSIVALAVLTEAEENRVDGHFVNGQKAMTNQKGENAADDHGNRGVVEARLVLEMYEQL